ncbi:MAG: hypothetical protein NZ601_04135 [candidate division WOR-3 bacterium]|nr:hypothetical protein [candidate division WOR-3 bacterium]MCX7757327.1 hypothetical protein [candidate division WOR-3 bacterium]MDW7988417.1 hypothetical protein [candidate division WOR-3 bacterium]
MGVIDSLKGMFALLLLQAGWCYQKKQALGFIYALSVFYKYQQTNFFQKVKVIYDSSFNTNPYCSGVLLGITVSSPKISENYFIGLQHLYGSLGDEFFWRTLRPILLMLASIFPFCKYLITNEINLSYFYIISPAIFLIPFVTITQYTRYYWFFKATRVGNKAAISLANFLRKPLPLLYQIKAFISGILLILILCILLFGFSLSIVSLKNILGLLFIITALLFSLLRIFNKYEMSSYILIIGLLIFLIIKLL